MACACLGVVSCGGTKADSRYPPRPLGCEVYVYKGPVPPSVGFDKIGGADVICAMGVSDADCARTLKDEACKLGGDMIYDIPAEPTHPAPDKVKWAVRVGHTKVPARSSP